MKRLERLISGGSAGLVVIWGRRRIGKSRLLTEWCRKCRGSYWVADESSAAIQRSYLAVELESLFPGISLVDYPDWSVFLDRISGEARAKKWHGPLVLDEFPYLVAQAPELPSVLQRWVDSEKMSGGITLVLSGSSQCMMQSSILDSSAPLYGRADEIIRLEPILPGYIKRDLLLSDASQALDFYACWGGVPRYWELAESFGTNQMEAVNDLVLSPLGVFHDEVERLLRQEMPSAVALRPILDAIGLGANKSSEIAGRLQVASTSIARPLKQLQDLGYIRREVSYGENEKKSKKSLYKLADPFLRLWFRVVAPHKGVLQTAGSKSRLRFLTNVWSQLRAEAWEDLCRRAIPSLHFADKDWWPAGRHWVSGGSEWDVVSHSLDSSMLLLGECKSLSRRAGQKDINKIIKIVLAKKNPLIRGNAEMQKKYLIFVPSIDADRKIVVPDNVHIIDGRQIFDVLV